jgi:pimeloyl-ACP methyl ester carboxylesterase
MLEVMNEQTLTLGPGGYLVATLTMPSGAAAGQVRCIALLTNSGVISRAGPHRINVHMARRLAARGIASIRFDLSGLGDSRRAAGVRPQMQQWVADTRIVMDFAAQRLGCSSFFMVGFCSGAEVAYQLSLEDERLRGMLLWDLYAYPTLQSRVRTFMFKLQRAGAAGMVRKLIQRAARLVGVARSAEAQEPKHQELDPQRMPPFAEFAANIERVMSRGTEVLVMYCGGEPDWYNYAGQFHDAFSAFPAMRQARCERLEMSDHLLTRRECREAFIASLERWLDSAVLPRIDSTPAQTTRPAREARAQPQQVAQMSLA